MGGARRNKGDGSIYRKCEARWGCPPKDTDGTRPEHACYGRWFGEVDVTVMGQGRKRRAVSAKTKQEVRVKLTRLQRRVAQEATAGPDQPLAQWLTYWLTEVAQVRPSTLRGYRTCVDWRIIPALGDRPLRAITPEDVRALLRAMEVEGRAPSTRKQALSVLSRALDVALREGKIERNPCATVARPSLARQATHGSLTLAQVSQLMPHILAHPNAARWATAVVLGIRQGEALGLAWDDVHLDPPAPVMMIHQAQIRDLQGKLALGPVKSRAAERAIPIVSPVLEVLREHKARSGGEGLVWGPRRQRTDYAEWHALLDAAGLERVPVHAARATAASVLDALGATPRQVADILGHSQVHVGQAHYVHSSGPDLRAALDRAGRAMLGGRSPDRRGLDGARPHRMPGEHLATVPYRGPPVTPGGLGGLSAGHISTPGASLYAEQLGYLWRGE